MEKRSYILGTAGHIDHGKTALVAALTGIDTDRLPEEKKRGITIDLGFAPLDIEDDVHYGIVDVPGHERFIRNMLAGSVGIDVALLVVAADDSIMPQTREHLAILQILNIRRGIVAITKSDLVDPDWLELVEDDVSALTKGTFLEGAPIVRTSARTGEGIDELKTRLAQMARTIPESVEHDYFRLAVDRSFVLEGLGTVVTGSVSAGTIKTGDTVDCLPQAKSVRVRSLQSHGVQTHNVTRGRRAAINLMGIHHTEIQRGCELVTPGRIQPTRIITAHVQVLPDAPLELRHRARVRLHVGTQEIIASVHMLSAGTTLEPGQESLVQLFTSTPVSAMGRQPFVLRAESPLVTIGGGQVLATIVNRIPRRRGDAIKAVRQMAGASPENRAAILISLLDLAPVDEIGIAQQLDATLSDTRAILDQLVDAGRIHTLQLSSARRTFIHDDNLQQWTRRVLAAVQREHDAAPLSPAVSRQRLAGEFAYVDPTILGVLLNRLIESDELRALGADGIALPGFEPALTAAQRTICEAINEAYKNAAFSPPEPAELAVTHGISENEMKQLLDLCVASGRIVHLGTFVYLAAPTYDRLIQIIRSNCTADGLTMAAIRDLLDTSRKYALPIVAHLDKIGITRRVGDLRLPGPALSDDVTPRPGLPSGAVSTQGSH